MKNEVKTSLAVSVETGESIEAADLLFEK